MCAIACSPVIFAPTSRGRMAARAIRADDIGGTNSSRRVGRQVANGGETPARRLNSGPRTRSPGRKRTDGSRVILSCRIFSTVYCGTHAQARESAGHDASRPRTHSRTQSSLCPNRAVVNTMSSDNRAAAVPPLEARRRCPTGACASSSGRWWSWRAAAPRRVSADRRASQRCRAGRARWPAKVPPVRRQPPAPVFRLAVVARVIDVPCPPMPRRTSLHRSDAVAQDSDALDLDLANITRLHEDRGLARRTDAGRVPVTIRSPGSRLMPTLIAATSVATSKIRSLGRRALHDLAVQPRFDLQTPRARRQLRRPSRTPDRTRRCRRNSCRCVHCGVRS